MYNENIVSELVQYGYGSIEDCILASTLCINFNDINEVIDKINELNQLNLINENKTNVMSILYILFIIYNKKGF